MTLTSTQIGQLVAQFFLAGAGTLSFAVLFACPKRTLPCCALVGAVGWFVYELAVLYGADAAAASLIAIIPLSLAARICAVLLKTPVTVFLLTGIFPLVPGAGIYYSRLLLHPGRECPFAGQRHLHLQGRRDAGCGHRAGAGSAHAPRPVLETQIDHKTAPPLCAANAQPGVLLLFCGLSGQAQAPPRPLPPGAPGSSPRQTRLPCYRSAYSLYSPLHCPASAVAPF